MIFMGLEFMQDVPFHEVFIHGLILDALGRKMSKSLRNGIDPLALSINTGQIHCALHWLRKYPRE